MIANVSVEYILQLKDILCKKYANIYTYQISTVLTMKWMP